MAFAVWLTGLPASGKSTIAAALVAELRTRGLRPVVLESDSLRGVLTPHPTYTEAERDAFYGALVHFGALFVEHDVPVIFDATANRRRWREAARARIQSFIEVWVDRPIELCRGRDPKGIYRAAHAGEAPHVPGIGEPYEPPEHPELILPPTSDPTDAARMLIALLESRGELGKR
jgi:adenylylsulfate kinase